MSPRLKAIAIALTGWKTGSQRDSNWRRALTRATAAFAALLFIEAMTGSITTPLALGLLAYSTLVWSLFYFGLVVFLQPLRSSSRFTIDAQRLLTDTFISAAMMILAFAALFRHHAIHAPDYLGRDIWSGDTVYFSAVTFSTLGFGDFAPIGWSRLYAAIEALMGNIHLGFVVGSIFAIVGKSFSR